MSITRRAVFQGNGTAAPPNFHVFCNSIAEGVCLEDFFPAGPRVSVVLTSGLGIAGLRAFNETLPLPCTNAWVSMDAKLGVFDLSFMTGIRRLGVFYPKDLSLTLPTSVVSFKLNGLRLAVSGTENITRLVTEDERPALGACPRLREFDCLGRYSPRRRFASATRRPSSG